MKTLKDIGELVAIERVIKYLPKRADIVQGAGDDCAIIKPYADSPHDWLFTSDAVIQNIHFTRETSPAAIGHKAVGRVLSDLAAMGGDPRWALIDIVAPSETPVATLDALYQGAVKLSDHYNLAIVGGDMAQAAALEMHVFAVGCVPTGSALLRSNASPGDLLFVTGSLGGSIMEKHLSFEPRVNEGIWLRDWATALIDITDGLATDLGHLTTMSKTGARLNITEIPLSHAALNMDDKISPLDHALYDGEDFELLFTLPSKKEKAFLAAWRDSVPLPCSLIGRMTDKTGVIECVDKHENITLLKKTGYEHFSG